MGRREKRHKPGFWHSRLTGIVSVSMVLFLLGLVVMIGLMGRELKAYVQESMTVAAIMSPNATDNDVKSLEAFLKAQASVKDMIYISKDEALKEVSKELGEDPQEFLGWNPMSPAFELHLKSEVSSDRDAVNAFITQLEKHTLVQRVNYKRDLLDEINNNIRIITLVMIVVAGLLLLVSFTLISNTIRLLIYARRFSIYTMRLVGATPGFIRRPFVMQNMWNGLVAAFIALALLVWGAYYVVSLYPVMGEMMTWQNGAILAGVLVFFGMIISVWSAVVTVNKYMRMDMNKLYRI
ncbi:cell division protein FtsX [Porphyromonas cangingivalis]|uniref:Cell division protein FtsX n=1 Tax=Porphyromonas cangingivalis TaxID=36874 RepID=A0A1T4MU81_PORCN|nr:permease-like cell division protein FtsX [Porphyromonas cangingivalis]SJZ70461.1 cell division transport system permease protein [Porphyromonas cangingivalis]VEJ01772.1 Cell division protein FtsX [Porphyromonas cangingivalis]